MNIIFQKVSLYVMKKLFLFLLLPLTAAAQDKTFYLSGGGSIIAQPMGANSYYVYKLNPYIEYPASTKQVVAAPPKRDLIGEVDAVIANLRESRLRK